MTQTTTSFVSIYTTAASLPAPIAPEMQDAILRYALTKNAPEGEHLLTLMAKRSDLSPSSEAKLSKVSAAKVKAIWLSRPGLTSENIASLLKGEKRATVLAAIASSSEASESLLSILASDPRPTVAWAIFHNSKSSEEARSAAFLNLLASSRSLDYDGRHSIQEHLKLNPDIHERAAKITKDPELLTLCLPGLAPESYKGVAQTLVFAPFDEALASGGYYRGALFEAIGKAGLKIITAAGPTDPTALEVALCLKKIINDPNRPSNPYNTVFTKEMGEMISLLVGSDEEKAEAVRLANEVNARFKAANSSDDQDLLSDLVELAILETTQKNAHYYNTVTQALASHLIKNPNLPLAGAERLVRFISREDIMILVKSVTPSPSTEEEYAFLARTLEVSEHLFDTLVGMVKDSQVFVDIVIDKVLHNPHPQTADYMVTSIIPKILNFDSSSRTLKKIPLARLMGPHSELMIPLIVEAAGTNPKIWQNFEVLAKGFEGSLGDFLEVSALLAD